MADRQRVVVDVETTGLDHSHHVAVEVAWWCLSTGARGRFIPPHGEYDIAGADTTALEMNGYWDRGLDNPNRWDNDGTEAGRLHEALVGNTMAGSNPRFDATMLRPVFSDLGHDPEPCHHRLEDLASYAKGILRLKYLPGLTEVCERLNVSPNNHTAEADVTATGLCFQELDRRRDLGPAAAGLVVLDPGSDDDIERVTRLVLRINPGTRLSARERNHGRGLLRQLRSASS